MRIEGQLERAEALVKTIEQAEEGVRGAETSVAVARQQLASARSQAASEDKDRAAAGQRAVASAEAAVSAAEAALERERRNLGTAQAAREQMVGDMRAYVTEQGRAASDLSRAQAAAPYGADSLSNARSQVARHAQMGNRVLRALGAGEIALEDAGDAAPELGRRGAAGGGVSLESGGAGGGGRFAAAGPQAAASSSTSAYDGVVDQFRANLRTIVGMSPPSSNPLFWSGDRLVGTHELDAAQMMLDRAEQALSGRPEAPEVMERLNKVVEEELAPRKLNQPPALAKDRANVPLFQDGHCNPHPYQDIESSYYLTVQQLGRDSAEGKEAAWRYADILEEYRSGVGERLKQTNEQLGTVQGRIDAFFDSHDMSALDRDGSYELVGLYRQRDELLAQRGAYTRMSTEAESRLNAVTAGLDPSERTTFVGLDGSDDFASAGDPLITRPQGYEYDDLGGCCGIGSSGSMINEQLGTQNGWAHYADAYLSAGLADYLPGTKWAGDNGGTSASGRCAMMRRYGLSANHSSTVSLDEIADLRKKGYSVGLAVHAQDLARHGLAPRSASSIDTMSANHAVTVIGCSVNRSNEVTGVWINDTGGWLSSGRHRSNRIFISAEQYKAMSDPNNTWGFSVEWARNDQRKRPPVKTLKKH